MTLRVMIRSSKYRQKFQEQMLSNILSIIINESIRHGFRPIDKLTLVIVDDLDEHEALLSSKVHPFEGVVVDPTLRVIIVAFSEIFPVLVERLLRGIITLIIFNDLREYDNDVINELVRKMYFRVVVKCL